MTAPIDADTWPQPALGDQPLLPAQARSFALAIEAEISDTTLTVFNPRWRAGGVLITGAAQQQGYYQVVGAWCWVSIWVLTDTNTLVSNGSMAFDLPLTHVPERSLVQDSEAWMQGKMYMTGFGTMPLYGLVSPGTKELLPFGMSSVNDRGLRVTQRADAAGTAGTGWPRVEGWQYAWPAGSNMLIQGTYRVA